MKEKKVIAITGLMSSGKGTAAEYLKEKYGASTYTFSTMLKDALSRFYLPNTRDNLIKISEWTRNTFGEDIMAQTMAKDVEKDTNTLIVIEGVRREADIEYLQKLPGYTLIEIVGDPKIRYERLTHRTEKADDQTKTYEQFLEDHKRSTEMSIIEVAKKANTKIDNNGNLEHLYSQLDAIV